MHESLVKLAEGCIDVHCKATNTRDAKKEFSRIIKAAYDKGCTDTLLKKEEKPKAKEIPEIKEIEDTPPKDLPITQDSKTLLDSL